MINWLSGLRSCKCGSGAAIESYTSIGAMGERWNVARVSCKRCEMFIQVCLSSGDAKKMARKWWNEKSKAK